MKVSLNWVKEFTKVDLPIDQLVDKIGAQLGAVEQVEDLGKKYQGIVVAKVISCEKHPDADKLSVCLIDDGGAVKGVNRDDKGYVQIVCGAPNVKPTLLVAWIPPGVVVPSSHNKEPLTLEARDIRGVVSNGMLASAHELGISDDHNGILELDELEVSSLQSPVSSLQSPVSSLKKGKPGDDFARTYKLDDYIIDIENKMFTHRPDCFGQLGVAREVAGIMHQQFTSPEWYGKQKSFVATTDAAVKGFSVDNQVPELCPRYMGVVVSGITVGPSPVWLQSYLTRVGVRPINNIVDITNYMMMLSGQPLHAFDFDKVAVDGKATIVVRKPQAGETMTLLDGKTITPRLDAVLICDQDKPIALGGVMGGNNSEIDLGTTRIIIECANFDMYNIRRTAMEHGLFTDAVTRFTKGQSPLQCPPVLYKTVQMIQELCPDAKTVGLPVDAHSKLPTSQPVIVSAQFVNERLGGQLSSQEMAKLLQNVEFDVETKDDALTITPPFWRTDIHIPEDIVEEVGRLYGYDHLPLELPKRRIEPITEDTLLAIKHRVRDILSRAGANELLTYSFVHGDLLDKVGQDKANAFQIANALSPDLQYYRLSLIPSLLDKVHANIKAGFDEFALFEINPVHSKDLVSKDDKLPIEDQRVALVFAAGDKTAKANYSGAPYYQAKQYLTALLKQLGITKLEFQPATTYEPKLEISKAAIAPFEKTRTSLVKTKDGQFIAELGEFRPAVRKSLKLPSFVAGFELDVMQLMKLWDKEPGYVPLPRFPKVEQDITLRVPADVAYGQIYDGLHQALDISAKTTWHLSQVDIYQPDNDKTYKHFSFRFTIASYERTLTAEEVNVMLDKAAASVGATLKAERI